MSEDEEIAHVIEEEDEAAEAGGGGSLLGRYKKQLDEMAGARTQPLSVARTEVGLCIVAPTKQPLWVTYAAYTEAAKEEGGQLTTTCEVRTDTGKCGSQIRLFFPSKGFTMSNVVDHLQSHRSIVLLEKHVKIAPAGGGGKKRAAAGPGGPPVPAAPATDADIKVTRTALAKLVICGGFNPNELTNNTAFSVDFSGTFNIPRVPYSTLGRTIKSLRDEHLINPRAEFIKEQLRPRDVSGVGKFVLPLHFSEDTWSMSGGEKISSLCLHGGARRMGKSTVKVELRPVCFPAAMREFKSNIYSSMKHAELVTETLTDIGCDVKHMYAGIMDCTHGQPDMLKQECMLSAGAMDIGFDGVAVSTGAVFVGCNEHIGNTVNKTLCGEKVPECNAIMQAAMKIQVFFRGSPKRHGKLCDVQKDAGMRRPKKHMSYSDTRFNTYVISLIRSLELLPHVNKLVADEKALLAAGRPTYFDTPTRNEFFTLNDTFTGQVTKGEEICTMLKPALKRVTLFGSELRYTITQVIPTFLANCADAAAAKSRGVIPQIAMTYEKLLWEKVAAIKHLDDASVRPGHVNPPALGSVERLLRKRRDKILFAAHYFDPASAKLFEEIGGEVTKVRALALSILLKAALLAGEPEADAVGGAGGGAGGPAPAMQLRHNAVMAAIAAIKAEPKPMLISGPAWQAAQTKRIQDVQAENGFGPGAALFAAFGQGLNALSPHRKLQAKLEAAWDAEQRTYMARRSKLDDFKKYGLPLDEVDNPLRYQYWADDTSKILPLHAIVAEVILCIPAAAISNEGLNSVAGHLSRKQRANTKPETLEFLTLAKLIYLKEYKKSERLAELEAAAIKDGWIDWDEVNEALGLEDINLGASPWLKRHVPVQGSGGRFWGLPVVGFV